MRARARRPPTVRGVAHLAALADLADLADPMACGREVALASGLLRTPSDNSTSLVLATERDLSADATLSEFIQRTA